MAHSTSDPPRLKPQMRLPSAVVLAAWRLRRMWRLLLVTGLGMLAAVTLICTAPLFSQVTLTAGLRGVLVATPKDSEISIHAQAAQLSTSVAAQDNQQIDGFIQQHVGNYLDGHAQFSIQLPPLHIASFLPLTQLQPIGASMQASTSHLRVLQGRLPQTAGDAVEIALTPETANAIHATLGEEYTGPIGFFGPTAPITGTLKLRLVGIFTPIIGDPFWHGETFAPESVGTEFTLYTALMSNDGFLAALTRLETQVGGNLLLEKPDLYWYYQLNVTLISMADVDDLIDRLNTAQLQIAQQFGNTPTLVTTQMLGPAVESFGNPSTLEKYRDRVSVVQIPVDIVALQVFCLALFFVSMMSDLLVDSQAEVIALLRSRGASRWQVFGSFLTQSAGLGIIVLITGPLLAMLLTRFLAQTTLPAADQNALNIIGNPLQVAEGVGWYALAAAVGAVLAMIIAIRSSASRDVLAMRRESARATHRPIWQRLYLDMVAALIALGGFAVTLYVTHANIADARVNLLISAPLALVAPIFLVIAGVLFFLRFFPLLVHQAARFAARRQGAAPMLALAQMARAPRQAMRMVLLLALVSSFAMFSLVFTASESQQIATVAANQTGADFSGTTLESIVPNTTIEQESLAQRTAAYHQIPGVISATLGFASSTLADEDSAMPLEIRAVDTQTFAQTAIWTDQDSTQSLPALMRQLRQASSAVAVPAIVDTLAANELHLTPGVLFTLPVEDAALPFIATAEVQHIPTVNDSLDALGTSDYTPPGGVLVDYQALASEYQARSQGETLSLNYVWLRSSDDPALLAKVRAALSEGPLQLAILNDRRAMMADLQQDPLYLNLITVLWLGMIITIPLACWAR